MSTSQRRALITSLVFFVALVAPVASPQAMAGVYSPVNAFPNELFAKESSPIIFTYQFRKSTGKPEESRLALIQVDEAGKKLRYLGIMSDDGVMGDKVRGDLIFTRKHQLSEKKAGKLYYAVVDESETGAVPEKIDPGQAVSIEIVRRPSFVELVSSIWSKIVSKL